MPTHTFKNTVHNKCSLMLSHNSTVATWGCYRRAGAAFTSQTRPEVIYEHNKTLKHSQSASLHFMSIHLITLLVTTRAEGLCAVNKINKSKQGCAPQDRSSHLWARPSRVRRGLDAEQKSERLRRFLGSRHEATPTSFQAAPSRSVLPSSGCRFLVTTVRDTHTHMCVGVCVSYLQKRAC